MLKKTLKDSSLDDLINRLQQKLISRGFNTVQQSFQTQEIDRWTTHIRDLNCSLLHISGQGDSEKEALLNALENYIHSIATHKFWLPYYLGDELSKNKHLHYPQEAWITSQSNDSILNKELLDFYDDDCQLNINNLIETNSSQRTRGVCCIPYICLRTKEKVNFPVNIITNIYSHNGIAIGSTLVEAKLNALCEIIKNYVKYNVIIEGVCLPSIPENVLKRYPKAIEKISNIKNKDYSFSIKDASLNSKYPVIAIVLINNKDQKVTITFGAHPIFEIALDQAINAMLEQLSKKDLQTHEAGFDRDEISSPENLAKHFNDSNGIVPWNILKNKPDFEFVDWEMLFKNEDINTLCENLCRSIYTEASSIFVFHHQSMGYHTCNIIVPGMSEIYPIDDLIWENNNIGINVRDKILKHNKTAEETEQLIIELEELGQDDEALISNIICMPSDPDDLLEDLTLNELVTLLALKIKDNERIQEGCEWLLHYKKIKPYRLKVYHCINSLMQLDKMAVYSTALTDLYTEHVLNDALALLAGEDIFPIISEWKTHKSLIEAYKKMAD